MVREYSQLSRHIRTGDTTATVYTVDRFGIRHCHGTAIHNGYNGDNWRTAHSVVVGGIHEDTVVVQRLKIRFSIK